MLIAASLSISVPSAARRIQCRLVVAMLLLAVLTLGRSADAGIAATRGVVGDPAIVTVYPAGHPRGVMATSGGWAYCYQVQRLARQAGYTLACGRFYQDGYTGFGLRAKRHEDWGNSAYLASFAHKISVLHSRVGGKLILIGVSYSGFGIATLASHHPELRPDRLIVIDSYLDLVARRAQEPNGNPTAREIDAETGGSEAALRERSVSAAGLTRLVRGGTALTVIWSVAPAEKTRYFGATCDRDANAHTLSRLAVFLRRSVPAWVTENRHGVDLWHFGANILADRNPGRVVVFEPDGAIPSAAIC